MSDNVPQILGAVAPIKEKGEGERWQAGRPDPDHGGTWSCSIFNAIWDIIGDFEALMTITTLEGKY